MNLSDCPAPFAGLAIAAMLTVGVCDAAYSADAQPNEPAVQVKAGIEAAETPRSCITTSDRIDAPSTEPAVDAVNAAPLAAPARSRCMTCVPCMARS